MTSHPKAVGGHVLVSGGTAGIGLAAAVQLARSGAQTVVVVGRDANRGESARAEVAAAGAAAHFLAGDASDPYDSGRLAAAAADLLDGRIDTFVSAVAPRAHLGPLSELDPKELHDVLVGLVLPVMQMNRAVFGYMRVAGGTIVNVASDAAKVPTPGESVAGGAMAAITMFSRTLALEVKRFGIRVHAVTPTLVADSPTAERLLADEFGARVFRGIVGKAELGLPNAHDIAETIVWLASPAAAKMTGQVISVNGGVSAG